MIEGLLESSNVGEEVDFDRALRPECFKDYIGQADLINKLGICIEAAAQRDEPMDHTLLFGPPGLGKTTIAHIIAKESEAGFTAVNAQSIKSAADLLQLLKKLSKRDVFFIDEIHSLDKRISELLYSAMEDFQIDVKLGNQEIVPVKTNPFCLIGATTAAGKIAPPLRDRFGILYTFRPYEQDELAVIIRANCNKLNLRVEDDAGIANLAARARGTPRIANRLLRRVRDYAQLNNNNGVNREMVERAMEIEGIDSLGLMDIDKKYLTVLYERYNCGPVGIKPMSASCGEDEVTISSMVEPFLDRIEFITRTQRGRVLSAKGMEYIFNNLKDRNGVTK